MWRNKTRPDKTARVPYAYIASEEDPLVFILNLEVTGWVETAFDHLEEGHSSRRVAAWLVKNRIRKSLNSQQEGDFMATIEVCLEHKRAKDFFSLDSRSPNS